MKASRVHAVIAAGLDNPQLLARWRAEPDSLRGCGVEPEAIDLDALWRFAGLAVKVRHNGLRASLPLTFRLFNVAGLEIDVFASYASFRAAEGERYADTTDARTQDLLSFLEGWLDFDRREHVLLRDVIRYEMALAELGKSVPSLSAAEVQAGEFTDAAIPTSRSVPHVCGRIVLHEMRCDPRAVGATLYEKSPRLDEVPLGTFHFCFWRSGAAAEVNILQLDTLGFYLLMLADGKRSAADLSRLTGGGGRPRRGFLKALGELATIGVLGFDVTPDQAQ